MGKHRLNTKNRLYPSTYFEKHPRMSVEDWPVWKQYLLKNYEKYMHILYDFPLGKGSELPKTDPSSDAESYRHLTKKRVDAIGETPTEIHLFEVKPRLTPKALGQAMTYLHLYKKQEKPRKKVRAIILCQLANEDDLDCCSCCGAEVHLVE